MNPSQTLNPYFHTPSTPVLIRAAAKIQDDVDYYALCDAARPIEPQLDALTQAYQLVAFGAVPERIHNLSPDNVSVRELGIKNPPVGTVKNSPIFTTPLTPEQIHKINTTGSL